MMQTEYQKLMKANFNCNANYKHNYDYYVGKTKEINKNKLKNWIQLASIGFSSHASPSEIIESKLDIPGEHFVWLVGPVYDPVYDPFNPSNPFNPMGPICATWAIHIHLPDLTKPYSYSYVDGRTGRVGKRQ